MYCVSLLWVQASSLVLQAQALLEKLQLVFNHLQEFCKSVKSSSASVMFHPQHMQAHVYLLEAVVAELKARFL